MAKKKDPEYHKQKLLEALERNYGIVTPACNEVGLTRQLFYQYCRTDDAFKAAVDEIQEYTLDFVENELMKKIKGGSEKSILFYMKYKARKRGYTDSVDITSNGEKVNNIQIEIIKKNNEKE